MQDFFRLRFPEPAPPARAWADGWCDAFCCPCGQGAGRLMSGVVQFAGQPMAQVARGGILEGLGVASHDGVLLELRCPSDHVFFVAVALHSDGGSVTRVAGEETS